MSEELMREELVQAAIDAAGLAWAPYSNFPVGAALLTAEGQVYRGCNIESAASPATICAERTALVKAVSEGARDFRAIAVVTRSGGSPCGVCRQMLFEFAPDMHVVVATLTGEFRYEVPLRELLPRGFGPADRNG